MNLQLARRSFRAGRFATSLAVALLVISLLPVAPGVRGAGRDGMAHSGVRAGRGDHDLRRQTSATGGTATTQTSLELTVPEASPVIAIKGGTSSS